MHLAIVGRVVDDAVGQREAAHERRGQQRDDERGDENGDIALRDAQKRCIGGDRRLRHPLDTCGNDCFVPARDGDGQDHGWFPGAASRMWAARSRIVSSSGILG